MCGRTCCTLNATRVARACGLQNGDADSIRTVHMDRHRPSYNISPGAYVPVFTVGSKGHGAQVGQPYHAVHCMKWGLVPSFTKKTEKPDHYRMFNARSESVKEKASFRRLIPNNRCLVAVDGFYEWKKDGSRKQPYYIHFSDGRPLVFAAIYDSWENSEGDILYTFTILTTCSSPALEWLHDRMPVIFGSKGTIDIWLNNPPLKLETVLAPYTGCDLAWYPVTSAMGKPSFGGPECIKEITQKPAAQNQISKLFSKKADDSSKCRPEPECGKASDGDNPDNLKEEEAVELTDDEKHVSEYFPSARDKLISKEFRGIKREFEELGPDPEIKSEMPDCYSTAVKRKPQAGDKQASLLSYFGRK